MAKMDPTIIKSKFKGLVNHPVDPTQEENDDIVKAFKIKIMYKNSRMKLEKALKFQFHNFMTQIEIRLKHQT